jgi:hypothetical protein
VYLLNTRKLVEDLAANRVSPLDKVYYLLVGWVLYSAIGYSTLTFANVGRHWLGLFEFFMITVVAVLGMQRCYEVSGGDQNHHFVVDFTCLLVPLTIKVWVVVWGLYWLFAWPYNAIVGPDAVYSTEESARTAFFLSRHAGWLATLAAAIGCQVGLFWRMRVHMSALTELREPSNPLMQPTGQERPAAD